ncbi:MAG: hypothetical protein HY313_06105 [Acidobacteria bacterium]|nr:hypothetical protein [Acidobacteriota bacterium]
MNLFKLEQLAALIAQIEGMISLCDFPMAYRRAADPIPEQLKLQIVQTIPQARMLFSDIRLTESVRQVDLAGHYLSANPPPNVSEAKTELRRIIDTLITELKERKFLFVESSLIGYVDNQAPFGQQVYDAFPSARFDITEAGNSITCRLNSAAGFHLVRAAEVGLWELGKDRRIPLARAGKIEFAEWGHIIGELENEIKAIQQWPNSYVKEDAHKFYNSALVEIRSFNDGWRRHLAHVRKTQQPLRDDEALALLGHIERFLKIIATKISEGNYTPTIWK